MAQGEPFIGHLGQVKLLSQVGHVFDLQEGFLKGQMGHPMGLIGFREVFVKRFKRVRVYGRFGQNWLPCSTKLMYDQGLGPLNLN